MGSICTFTGAGSHTGSCRILVKNIFYFFYFLFFYFFFFIFFFLFLTLNTRFAVSAACSDIALATFHVCFGTGGKYGSTLAVTTTRT